MEVNTKKRLYGKFSEDASLYLLPLFYLYESVIEVVKLPICIIS